MRDTVASAPQPLAIVDGWPVNLASLHEAVSSILQAAARKESFAVFTLNLDHLDKLRRLPRFRHAYAKARFITADGAPVAMLAARQGVHVERTTGADLVVPIAVAAADRDVPVYLFGTTPGVLESAGRTLMQRTGSRLLIAGSEAPPQGFDPEGPEADAALDRIAASGANLCLVALGAPKQELFAARAVDRNVNVGFVCIGAGLDFIAGAQSRAPDIMQRNGLEWFWRLATNPRRLAARYARCALVLAEIIFLSPIRSRFARARA